MYKLLLITNGFPYGNSEKGFITTEVEELSHFFEIHILFLLNKELINEGIQGEDICWKESYPLISPKLSISIALRQIVKKDVLSELQRARSIKGVNFHIARSVLSYSARADIYQKIILDICGKQCIDLIYTYWCTPATLAAVRLKQLSSIKVVTRFHGYDLYNERADTGWLPFRHEIGSLCDKLFFVSKAGKDYFNSNWNFESKSKVSYLGCPDMQQDQTAKSNALHIASCSNLIPLKRVHLIIEALEQLPDSVEVSWIHIGGGELLPILQEEASVRLATKPVRYKFYGAVPHDDVERIFKSENVNLFITTSATEGGVPISLVEAFSMGIPAIGTDVGGIPEAIRDGYNGFLLRKNAAVSEISLALMKYALKSPEERAIFSLNARTTWEQHFNARDKAKEFCRDLQDLFIS